MNTMAPITVDKERQFRSIKELDVLWVTAGLGCDGESIAMTAAMQPSIEDVVLGAIPGIPKINLHNEKYMFVVRPSGGSLYPAFRPNYEHVFFTQPLRWWIRVNTSVIGFFQQLAGGKVNKVSSE